MLQTLDGVRHKVAFETPYIYIVDVLLDPDDVVRHRVGIALAPVAMDAVRHKVGFDAPYVYTVDVRWPSADAVRHFIGLDSPYIYTVDVRLNPTDAVAHKVRVNNPLVIKCLTTFDPAKLRAGMRSLELFPTGKTDTEILTIPINNIQKGVDRTWSLDLWHARLQHYDRVGNVRISAFSFVRSATPEGNQNMLGKEVVDSGYLLARKSGDASYTALSAGAFLNLGPIWPNDKITVDFKLSIPAGAVSSGRVMFGLKVEWQKAVMFGDAQYGDRRYGWMGGERRATARLSGLPLPNTTSDAVEHRVGLAGWWTKDGVKHRIGICG